MRAFHSLSAEEALAALQSSPLGISEQEAEERLKRFGVNRLQDKRRAGRCACFWRSSKTS